MTKSRRTSQKVSQPTLLQGSYFALHTAGCQARSASTLFDAGDHPTAAGIAMMAREEIGKHRLLKGLWKRGNTGGGAATLEEVERVCGRGSAKRTDARKRKGPAAESHLQKFEAAQLSVQLAAQPKTRLATAMRATMDACHRINQLREKGAGVDDPELLRAYAEARAADAENEEMVRLLNAEGPRLRFELRQEAFYTDLIVDDVHKGRMRWRRPAEIRLDEAHARIMQTANDYSAVFHNLLVPFIEGDAYPAALEGWVDKPPLPMPVWPTKDPWSAFGEKGAAMR